MGIRVNTEQPIVKNVNNPDLAYKFCNFSNGYCEALPCVRYHLFPTGQHMVKTVCYITAAFFPRSYSLAPVIRTSHYSRKSFCGTKALSYVAKTELCFLFQ